MTSQPAGDRSRYPRFRELPTLPDSPERHAWDVWGRDDQIGCMNFAGPEQVRQALTTVSEGTVVSLSLPLNEPAPGLFPKRSPFRHTILIGSHGRDDRLDGFFPQFSSQWDGLRHVRYRQYGFWGGRQDEAIDSGGELGVEHWSRRGVVTRGVLVDIKNFHERRGSALAPNERYPLTAERLDEVLAAQGSVLRQGDVLLIRTGWLEWYLDLAEEERAALQGSVGQGPGALACPAWTPIRRPRSGCGITMSPAWRATTRRSRRCRSTRTSDSSTTASSRCWEWRSANSGISPRSPWRARAWAASNSC